MWAGVKSFVAKPVGKAVLVVVSILLTTATFLYLGPYIATLALLVFGLVLPIYAGWKRPRQLAVAGLVILLATGPLTSGIYSDWIRQPSPVAQSATSAPYGASGAVLQNAVVDPFTAAAGSSFQFTADVHPEHVPAGDAAPSYVDLFVSTCPGATSNNSPSCGTGYPFYGLNHTLPANLTQVAHVSFNVSLPGNQIWWWQMGLPLTNQSTGNVTWVYLESGNGLSSVQGPVTGDYLSTFLIVLPAVYGDLAFFPGIIFFLALLVYVFFKSREARRKAMEAGPSAGRPADSSLPPGASPAGPSPSSSGPAAHEATCPNCHAIVYPNESSCWKCGTALKSPPTASPTEAPLPSSGPSDKKE